MFFKRGRVEKGGYSWVSIFLSSFWFYNALAGRYEGLPAFTFMILGFVRLLFYLRIEGFIF